MNALANVETTLEELVATVNREHALATQAARSVLTHAMAAGDALLAIKDRHIEYGQWRKWVEENVDVHWTTANDYMRVAYFRGRVEELGAAHLKEALALLCGERREGSPAGRAGLPGLREQAVDLRAQGMSDPEIAERLGVSNSSAYKWTRPEQVRKYAEKAKREKAELREQRERQEAARISRAVKKRGGALAELYAMSERMQDVLAQAHREEEDTEARRALSLAGEHYRRLRDQIVVALGAHA